MAQPNLVTLPGKALTEYSQVPRHQYYSQQYNDWAHQKAQGHGMWLWSGPAEGQKANTESVLSLSNRIQSLYSSSSASLDLTAGIIIMLLSAGIGDM